MDISHEVSKEVNTKYSTVENNIIIADNCPRDDF